MLLVLGRVLQPLEVPRLRRPAYYAEFKDASGLHKGNMVQVAGIRVGRVTGVELEDDKVLVTFEVDHGVEFGDESSASIEVLNLLGEKYLELTPAGSGQLDEDDVIPVERTQSAYDIVGVFGDLTTTTERIDTEQLQQALNVVSDTHERRRPGHPGELRGHLPALADRRVPRRGDPGAARELAEREQGARRPQRGHRRS